MLFIFLYKFNLTMIILVIGTRSEAIKFSTIIRELRARDLPFKILNSCQHGKEAIEEWMEKLDLPIPDMALGSSLREVWTGQTKFFAAQTFAYWTLSKIPEMMKIFRRENPKIVMYQGDTIFVPLTAIAARLAAKGIILAHRESGMRSHNIFEPMPEELNRIIADKFTDLHFCPTPTAVENLKREHAHGEIHYVGDPMVEIVDYILKKFGKPVEFKNYVTVTIHRYENINNPQKMRNLVNVIAKCPFNVVFPLNLNTRKKLQAEGLLQRLQIMKHVYLYDPIPYVEWINIVKNAEAILTDSGGMQEEACILKIPCMLMRNITEWEEVVKVGATAVTGFNVEKILNCLNDVKNRGEFYQKVKKVKNPLGDGKATKRIVDVLEKKLD
jgi:UDP-N-acetylglucosamine 2-epimerase (non-hydrolysing)